MPIVQFESAVDGDIIRIPAQYIGQIPAIVTVTFVDAEKPRFKPKTKKEKPSSLEEFSDLKLDTSNWKFDREEANERR
jgi:hypothetical protein